MSKKKPASRSKSSKKEMKFLERVRQQAGFEYDDYFRAMVNFARVIFEFKSLEERQDCYYGEVVPNEAALEELVKANLKAFSSQDETSTIESLWLPSPSFQYYRDFDDWLKHAQERAKEVKKKYFKINTAGQDEATLWLRAITIATLIEPDDAKNHKRMWDKKYKLFAGIPKRQSTSHKQAYCYDAMAFLSLLKEKMFISQEEYESTRRRMSEMLKNGESDPCEGKTFLSRK